MDDLTRVLLYGTFDGFAYSTDDFPRTVVVLDSGERVEVPKECVVSADRMVNKNKIKLKDVIARIKELDLSTQKVWLNEILNELGSDYGTLKYKAGYEQGKLEGAMEREKVTVPQFVADWIEYCKKHDFTLFGCLDPENGFESLVNETFEGDVRKCIRWCRKESNILAHAWLYGHTVEEEKRYYIRLKNVDENYNYLTCIKHLNAWALTEIKRDKKFRTEHTKKQLEEGDFGWVFDCPGVEIEEVEE